MDDIKPVNDSSDEIEHSPKDSEDAFQDESEESSRNPRTHRMQVLHPLPQDDLEIEQLKENESGMFQLGHSPTDTTSSSKLKPTSSPGNSTNEGLRPRLEVKTQECSSASSEKVPSNRNQSGFSTPEPNVESGEKSKKSSSRFRGKLPELTYRDLIESNLSEALLQESHNYPLYQRLHSNSVSSGASISRQRIEVPIVLDHPQLEMYQKQPSTSSRQSVITDRSSAGDRLKSSSGVAATGKATESNTSTQQISKYAFNAQTLLLTVLEEIMELDEEHNLYRKIRTLFLGLTELPCHEREAVLTSELFLYREQKKTAWFVRKLFTFPNVTSEYLIQESYENLVSQVVFALLSTVSGRTSLEFETIMDNYKRLKCLYERCFKFWSNDLEDIQDENSKIRVTSLKRMTQRLFLQTRNAYRELLMHIGEHAEEEIVNSFQGKLWEEDKVFLRRLF